MERNKRHGRGSSVWSFGQLFYFVMCSFPKPIQAFDPEPIANRMVKLGNQRSCIPALNQSCTHSIQIDICCKYPWSAKYSHDWYWCKTKLVNCTSSAPDFTRAIVSIKTVLWHIWRVLIHIGVKKKKKWLCIQFQSKASRAGSQFCYWVKNAVSNIRRIECTKPNMNLDTCSLIRND